MSKLSCTNCKRNGIDPAPMLLDDVWTKLARANELLCVNCFYARADERGVHVTLVDLLPCPSNLFHRPDSWFDIFKESAPPDVVAAWLADAKRQLAFWRTDDEHGDDEAGW